eukprot:TRINITY_DN21957_c0_g2_i3.p1 TRINITY_DN21957_c0_g2~~TRINITY_DN21957_c0_g2_i3.p1  ORF type:complete len:125 (-),score=0.80 TRINITY_DN21957_c0_g2_i3:224-598(-)
MFFFHVIHRQDSEQKNGVEELIAFNHFSFAVHLEPEAVVRGSSACISPVSRSPDVALLLRVWVSRYVNDRIPFRAQQTQSILQQKKKQHKESSSPISETFFLTLHGFYLQAARFWQVAYDGYIS